MESLNERLHAEDPQIRHAAVREIAEDSEPEDIPVLLRLAHEDPDTSVRKAALRALHVWQDAGILDIFVDAASLIAMHHQSMQTNDSELHQLAGKTLQHMLGEASSVRQGVEV